MKSRREDSRKPRTLSDYWRIDRSSDRSRELASVLGGIASQAELVQAALRGESSSHSAPIVLDPTLLNGFSAPFPPIVVDCLTGLGVREAALRALSIDSSRLPGWEEMSPDEKREFGKVHRALEDAYAFRRLGRVSKALVAYVSAMRVMMEPLELSRRRFSGDVRLTRESVFEAWLLAGRDCEMGSTGNEALRDAIRALDRHLSAYWNEDDPHVRLTIAEGVWIWLTGFPSDPAVRLLETFFQDADEWQEDRDTHAARLQVRKNVLGGGDTGSLTDLSAFLLEQVGSVSKKTTRASGDAKGANGVDITGELRELGIRAAATHIKDARYDADDHERVAAQVTDEIESVRHLFARLDAVNSRWRHGLDRGKVDGARLTKAAAGKTSVFKRRDRQERRSMALVFLIDVSASMRSYMPVVNRSACVLSEALRGLAPRVWYEVLTYTSGGLHPGSPVQLTRLASPGFPLSLRDVWSDGGTPTGEAIAAAALALERHHAERKLILHFTDGHPKDTYVVRQALEVCRRDAIDVLTVSVGASQEGLYGVGKCEVAYSVSELPDVLARLLPRLYRRG
jgi:Mg-chelatase subunit ChlD